MALTTPTVLIILAGGAGGGSRAYLTPNFVTQNFLTEETPLRNAGKKSIEGEYSKFWFHTGSHFVTKLRYFVTKHTYLLQIHKNTLKTIISLLRQIWMYIIVNIKSNG